MKHYPSLNTSQNILPSISSLVPSILKNTKNAFGRISDTSFFKNITDWIQKLSPQEKSLLTQAHFQKNPQILPSHMLRFQQGKLDSGLGAFLGMAGILALFFYIMQVENGKYENPVDIAKKTGHQITQLVPTLGKDYSLQQKPSLYYDTFTLSEGKTLSGIGKTPKEISVIEKSCNTKAKNLLPGVYTIEGDTCLRR